METPAVGIAVADLAIVGQVTALQNGIATVRISRALKGRAAAGEVIQVHVGTTTNPLMRCYPKGLAVGTSYVLLLWSPAGKLTSYDPIDDIGGVADPSAEKVYADALAERYPRSPWKRNQDLMTQLVLNPLPAHEGDIDLFVVFRNIGAKTIEFRYQDWPIASKSKCALEVVNAATRGKVAAKDVPIAKADITDYFSKNGRKYDVSIEPGASYLFFLFRITTAQRGWGYKEELGFLYYPISTPGIHTVAATCTNLFATGSVVTDPIRLPLR
jgi:hypothetical protein